MIKKLVKLFAKKETKPAPLLIIKKETIDADVKDYKSFEEVIADLEADPHVPTDKIEKLKRSLNQLKSKTSITIRNGEIIL